MLKKIKFKFNNNDYVKVIDTYSNRRRSAFTRDNSWEICYKVFYNEHQSIIKGNKIKHIKKDFLALNLGFYLASWGMYRGSSFMLQYDYRILIPVVEIVLNQKYKVLWNLDFNDEKWEQNFKDYTEKINNLFVDINKALISKAEYFKGCKIVCGFVSRTLITKIILGTIGCFPAIDTYVGNVLGNPFYDNDIFYKDLYSSVKYMLVFAKDNFADVSSKKLCISRSSLKYPLMKMYDIYLFQIGKQESFIKDLDNYINKIVSISDDMYKNAKPYMNKNIKIEDEVVILDEYRDRGKLDINKLKYYLDQIKQKYKSNEDEDEN